MNHYYNKRMRRLFNPYSFYGLHRIYHKTIIDEYQNAWVVSQSMNDENLRSCELKLIKLDKHELEWFLLQFYANNDLLTHCSRHRLFRKIKNGYAPCVLLHLINVFFMSNQKEKIKLVHVHLNELLHAMTEKTRYDIFERYLIQRLKVKTILTVIDLLTGQLDPQHEFWLKLCYWDILCANKDNGGCTYFLKINADFLLSNIEGVATNVQWQLSKNTQLNSCNILLCLLNWNICKTQTPVTFQNMETPSSSWAALVADTSINLYTSYKVSSILQIVLSTLSEDEIFTAFNEYLDQILTMKSEITEDDFCTGKIEPYHEFMLKLCYYEKLCTEHDDDETYRKFLRRNADFLVSQIEEVVDGNNTKTKLISCKVLLCLVKWDICNQKTVYTTLNKILSQMLTQKDDCQDFMNENALFFVSMVRTVIKRNNIPLLINLCDVLICISYIELHFCEVTGAINKLIRYYMNQVGTNERTLQSILLLGYRFLKYLNDNQKIDTARKKKLGFPKFCRLLKELSINSRKERKALDLLIEAFKDNTNPSYDNQNKYCNYLRDFTKEQDALKQDSCKGKLKPTGSIFRYQIAPCDSFSRQDYLYRSFTMLGEVYQYTNCMLHEHDSFSRWEGNVFNTFSKNFFEDILAMFIMVYILVVWTSPGHRSSAKLEKYLALKHHYAMASLYLLWCSGDIEVHPGPRNKQKTLVHDSSIKRTWIQNVCKMLDTTLSDGVQSKYREKQGRISDKKYRELFKDLLKVCHEEKVHVPKMYLAEINAWETMEYKLLHKLFIYRCEIETITASLQDFLTCGGSTKDLTDINVSIFTELKTNEIAMFLGQYQRTKDISQMVAHITRHIAGILIKCAHGKDPDAKCDGLWDLLLENWPSGIILFDPNNRGKYSKKYPGQKLISDQELVDMLLRLQQVTIPQKYEEIVDAFRIMRNSQKEKSINKQHKAELCSTFKRITSLEKLDYALNNLWESGIFTEEVQNNLNKWWTTGAIVTTDDKNCSQVDIKDAGGKERPHIAINISTKSITLSVEANSSQVSYNFSFKDERVPLKTMASTVHQTTIQKPSSDSYQMVTAKIHLTVSTKPDACSADNQNYSIIIHPLGLNSNSQAIMESDIKHQHKITSQKTALCSTIDFYQPTSSTKQISQLNQNINTRNQSTTNSDDISSATKDSQSLDFHMQVSPTSDIGSSDSISSINSESGNEERDQNNTLSEGQDPLTDSDYSSDSSNNCVPKTGLKKRKCIEEDRIEMKKRKIPSLKEDKKQSDPDSHRKIDSSMDNSTTSNKDMELLLDYLDIDLDSFDIDDQTFEVEMNALDNEDKNLEICDKDGNLMNDETQISNKNTTVSTYDTNVSSDLERFLHEMIYGESEKIIQMKSYLPDV